MIDLVELVAHQNKLALRKEYQIPAVFNLLENIALNRVVFLAEALEIKNADVFGLIDIRNLAHVTREEAQVDELYGAHQIQSVGIQHKYPVVAEVCQNKTCLINMQDLSLLVYEVMNNFTIVFVL